MFTYDISELPRISKFDLMNIQQELDSFLLYSQIKIITYTFEQKNANSFPSKYKLHLIVSNTIQL